MVSFDAINLWSWKCSNDIVCEASSTKEMYTYIYDYTIYYDILCIYVWILAVSPLWMTYGGGSPHFLVSRPSLLSSNNHNTWTYIMCILGPISCAYTHTRVWTSLYISAHIYTYIHWEHACHDEYEACRVGPVLQFQKELEKIRSSTPLSR